MTEPVSVGIAPTEDQGRIFRGDKEAAAFVNAELGFKISPLTIARRRSRGDGPKFGRISGRIEYFESDLREWIAAERAPRYANTAESAP